MKRSNQDSALEIVRVEQRTPGSHDTGTLKQAIDELVATTSQTYTRQSSSYRKARKSLPWKEDSRMNTMMLSAVRERLTTGKMTMDPSSKWKLLDVGAGYGRDILVFQQEGDIIADALENSKGFLGELKKLKESSDSSSWRVIPNDMRCMSDIESKTYHCVRNHATLHHLPVVGDGLGAEAALRECRRVLKDNGVFYVTVKAGNGISMIDTKEGLGGRFFQLFNPKLLRDLLEVSGFSIIHFEELTEDRGGSLVPWLFSLASTR